MIAVNIDAALIVQSCDFDFNLRRLERYLVMVRKDKKFGQFVKTAMKYHKKSDQ